MTWAYSGDLNTARDSFTCVTLNDGDVLAVAGNGAGTLSSCELYDHNLGTWAFVGSISVAKSVAQLVLFPNGKVLCVGGSTDNNFTPDGHVDLYDPVAKTWTAKASLNTARLGFGMWLLPSGKVLVAGGSTDGLTGIVSSELYDPNADTWTVVGNLNNPRFYHGFGLSGSGIPCVLGGAVSSPATVEASIEIYDTNTDTWSVQSSTLPAGAGHSNEGGEICLTLQDGTLIYTGGQIGYPVAGGTTASKKTYIYDVDNDVLTTAADMSVARAFGAMFPLPSGKILYAGGFDGIDAHPPYDTCEIYDPDNDTWTAGDNLLTKVWAPGFHSPTVLSNGKPILMGGYTGTVLLKKTELFTEGVTPPMAITLVQHVKNADGVVASMNLTVTATTPGNLLVLCAGGRKNGSSSNGAFVITDNSGSNTYTEIANTKNYCPNLVTDFCSIWYCANAASTTQLTVSFGSGSGYFYLACYEYSGAATVSPVDVSGSVTQNSGLGLTTQVGPTVITTNAGDVLISVCEDPSTLVGVNAPWGNFLIDGLTLATGSSDYHPGSAGSITGPTYTGSGGTMNGVVSVAAFLPAPSGPSAKQKASTSIVI